MLVTVSCGKLNDEKHKAVQNALDVNSEITDWIRYLDSNWIINYEGDNLDVLLKSVRSEIDINLLVATLHYCQGWVNKDVWKFKDKYKMLPEPEKATSSQQNQNNNKNPNIINPQNFILSSADKISDLNLNPETDTAVTAYFARLSFQIAAQNNNIDLPNSHRNFVLAGKPGIGKSTLAKSMAMKLKEDLNARQKINAYFVKPAQLIGSYRGHSQINMQKLLDDAQGGIIVIDEIDTLLDLDSDGKMILNVLNTHLGDKPNKPIIIGTLYEQNLEIFYNFNAGFRSRFPINIPMDEQSVSQLMNIFNSKVYESKLKIDSDAQTATHHLIEALKNSKRQNFAFIRDVDNVLSKIIDQMSVRHATVEDGFEFIIKEKDVPEYDHSSGTMKIRESNKLSPLSSSVIQLNR